MIDAPPPPKTTAQAEPETQGPSQDLAEQFRELKRHELDKGAILGRFVIVSHLDQGGMGAVYAAYDPELDRKVAIKLLLPVQERDVVAAQARLLREAQAMARLDDPNVVAIHDVGTLGDQIWLAMEYVEGVTLKRWLNKPRRWLDVLRIMLAVGRGLAAAHEKGLVHRDIKPANIMISAGDRARVMDFGLACAPVAPLALPASSADCAVPTREVDIMAVPVTRTGTVLGTAGYMAPEQHDGKPVDASADQFAFCVTLWEALYGERPFTGPVAGISARRRPPPHGAHVPGWLRRVVERGLAIEPARRWPSMVGLLGELERRRTGARARAALLIFASIAVIGAAGEGYRRWRAAQEVAACEAEGASIAQVWNDDVRARLREGLLATEAANAETTTMKVMPYFEQQADEWRLSRTATCLDTRVLEVQGEETLDRSVWCLDERRMEFEALIDEFSRADAGTLQHAVSAAAGLSMVSPCRDRHRLEQLPPLPTDRERVREVQQTLSVAGALRAAGEYGESLTAAQEALAAADEVSWPPLTAAARWRIGDLLSETGKYREAEVELEQAYFQAAEAGALEIAVDAAAALTWTVGFQQARHDDGIRWSRHAFVALAALGANDDSLRRAEALDDYASVQQAAGEYDEAKALYGQSLAMRERMLGPDHPQVAATLNNLATVHNLMGDHTEAKALLERALASKEQALGSDHPYIASTLLNLALAHTSTGAHAEAKALLEQARAVAEKTYAGDHPHVADILNSLTVVLQAMGSHEEARSACERALAIREKAMGPDHPVVATSLNNLAYLHFVAGAYDEARRLHERALAIREKTLDPDHPDIAASLNSLAALNEIAGKYEESRRLQERALAIQEKSLGPDHRLVGTTLNNLAIVHNALGHSAEAKALYARGLAVAEKTLGAEHPEVATNIYNLANAHYSSKEYGEAKSLHERALDIRERALGPDHVTVAYSLNALTKIALVEARYADAVSLALRALRVCEAGETPPVRLAVIRFTLARALWDAPSGQGRDRARALVLARQARETFLAANDKQFAFVEEWLAKHRDARR